jgi:predicted oxidoreductase
VAELAQKTGIDAGSLRQTVEAYNREAALGRDPQFGKGSKAYNRYQGDALHGPNPCVAPIVKGPYYAIKVMIGDIGTFAGLKVDGQGRALNELGAVIPGLYAVGNDACSIMGGNYPGAGITLGPALTFGYIAGQSIAAAGKAAARVQADASAQAAA